MATTIATIEKPGPSSRLWKVKNLIVKGWIFLKYSSGKEQNLFGIFLFFFTKAGLIFIWNFFVKILFLVFNYDHIGNRNRKAYKNWLPKHLAKDSSLKKYRKKITHFSYQPLISILIVESKRESTALEKTMLSLTQQVYPAWEIGIASPSSLEEVLMKQEFSDKKISFILAKEDSSATSIKNQLLKASNGEFILYLSSGDILTKDALYQAVKYLQNHPEAELLYTDEDRMDRKGNGSSPIFKPDWSPDTLLSYNYLAKSVLVKSSLIKNHGGFRDAFNGEETYDLYLRITEQTNHIHRIKKILYRQKISPYKSDPVLTKRLLEETLARRKEAGRVVVKNEKGITTSDVRYQIHVFSKISILIPTKDNTTLLSQCVESIFEFSTYPDFEIIVIDNNSIEKDFFEYIDSCTKKYPGRFSCIRHEAPFNFSEINNFAAAHSTGDYLVLLNNDTKVISPDWLEGMLEQAQRPSIGAVGVKLLYPDDSIQHAGIGFDHKQLPYHIFASQSKELAAPQVNMTTNYAALTAACIMVRKDVYQKTGGLDELFAIEFNDIDFCLKLKKSGYNNIYLPYVELYHYESLSRGSSHSTGEKYERHLKEKNLFLSRWSEYIKETSLQHLRYKSIL
jgi:O-antigen biosynthesis protein